MFLSHHGKDKTVNIPITNQERLNDPVEEWMRADNSEEIQAVP